MLLTIRVSEMYRLCALLRNFSIVSWFYSNAHYIENMYFSLPHIVRQIVVMQWDVCVFDLCMMRTYRKTRTTKQRYSNRHILKNETKFNFNHNADHCYLNIADTVRHYFSYIFGCRLVENASSNTFS